MEKTICISSTTNPRIKALLRLRRQRNRVKEGLLIAEGKREIHRAIEAGLRLVELYHCPDIIDDHSRGLKLPPDIEKFRLHRASGV